MSLYDEHDDRYDNYEDLFDPMQRDRQARRKRKPKIHHQPKKNPRTVIDEIAGCSIRCARSTIKP